ncbi:hypothetical protein HHI36_021961 [Cryptolaemus montrouzieri]|uniref:Fatty acyl-CoA reductase n=1 Tax=Cryptolaemus montrouzieri TaxID=559131 RepID=A0ABD2MYF6_9CUCU
MSSKFGNTSSEDARFGGSDIIKIYDGKTIFLTGATGYLGKMILEKLLRTCYSIKKIYLLVREKKGKEINQRFEDIFSGPIWETQQKLNPKYRDKVFLVGGDLVLPNLGLSEESQAILKNEVNIILHCAATVRFDQLIKTAAYINVRSVKDLIEIAKDTKHLDVFLYISTAYSHSPRGLISEQFYKPPMNHEDLLNLVGALSDEKLSAITPMLLGEWPNTYTFTKAIAESLIEKEGTTLPMVMCRPAIITGAVSEPLPGWADNIYGPNGLFLLCGLGIMRSIYGKKDNNADMVPSDYVVNSVIAALAKRCITKSDEKSQKISSITPVYNYCSAPEAPISWDSFAFLLWKEGMKMPSVRSVWKPFYQMRETWIHHTLAILFLHTIPAYLIDFFLRIIGQKPLAVEAYEKINKLGDVLSYFTLREWEFRNDNIQHLWKELNEEDRKLFPFTMENFDWNSYSKVFVRGARLYILKEPVETIPQGLKIMRRFVIIHYTLLTVLVMIALYILTLLVNIIWIYS